MHPGTGTRAFAPATRYVIRPIVRDVCTDLGIMNDVQMQEQNRQGQKYPRQVYEWTDWEK